LLFDFYNFKIIFKFFAWSSIYLRRDERTEFHRNSRVYFYSRLFAHRLSEFAIRSTPSLCSTKSYRVSTLHPTLTPSLRLYGSALHPPSLPRYQNPSANALRINEFGVAISWVAGCQSSRIIIHYQFDEDHPFDLVSGFISRASVSYWHLIQTRRSFAYTRWCFRF